VRRQQAGHNSRASQSSGEGWTQRSRYDEMDTAVAGENDAGSTSSARGGWTSCWGDGLEWLCRPEWASSSRTKLRLGRNLSQKPAAPFLIGY